jgi:integrase
VYVARSRRSWGSVRQIDGGRYQARYLDPETRHVVPAPHTFVSKSAADRWLARKRTELEAGTAADGRTGNRPLAEWWQGYWRSVQSHKARTKVAYATSWRLRVSPRFGSMPVRRIKPSHIDEWIADMSERGVSASKVIEATGVLKRMLDRVVRDRVIPANPCEQRTSTLPKRPKTDRPVLTPAEVERLAAAMTHDADRVPVRLLAYGGLRIGEALALLWRDVDLERKTLTVRESVEDAAGKIIVGRTKTYAMRTITLPGCASHATRQYKNWSCPTRQVTRRLPEPQRHVPALSQLATSVG